MSIAQFRENLQKGIDSMERRKARLRRLDDNNLCSSCNCWAIVDPSSSRVEFVHPSRQVVVNAFNSLLNVLAETFCMIKLVGKNIERVH